MTEKEVTNVVMTKNVVIESWSSRILYYVHGAQVRVPNTRLAEILHDVSSLLVTLVAFERMHVCKGLGIIDAVFARSDAFQDYSRLWRHKDCFLLAKKIICENCKKFKQMIRRRQQRFISTSRTRRMQSSRYLPDNLKLIVLRKKLASQIRMKNRAKCRIILLENELQIKQEEIAALSTESLDKTCSSFNVPEAQKMTLREIVGAAKRNPQGRRYSEEWLMLCMLMNIRGPSYYEFLRKNNIIPLPCTRTIRHYYSIIDSKCGFDSNFAQLLNKHFAAKKPMQRHGVLLLDEINLRKSISVCSRNLTYSGLTDFGSDGPTASDINNQATHGLVIMFQPIADTYTQPIAVFASQNPVLGDELAKLVVKAIAYVENCGALIHGVISDGAKTNKRMATILGVSGTLDSPQPSFTHPLDDGRKVFVFSDVPHLVKNIRNRLYNKRRLKVSITFVYLFS